MAECLAAFTPATPPTGYVSYVNISRDGDEVIITVRPESADGSGAAAMRLPVGEAQTLFETARAALGVQPNAG